MLIRSILADELMESDDMAEQPVPQLAGEIEKSLWVDKYSPKSYVELLSDDVSSHSCSSDCQMIIASVCGDLGNNSQK